MRFEKWSRRCRGPKLLREKFSTCVSPLMRKRVHLFHRVHAKVEDEGYARITLWVPPCAAHLDAEQQLPIIDAQTHQIGFVVVEELAPSGFLGSTSPKSSIVVAVQMNLVVHVAYFRTAQ